EDPRREFAVEPRHVLDRIAERQCSGDDRAGRGAADQIEPVAEVHLVLVETLAKDLLDLFQKGDRDGAAHASAVKRQQAFRPGAEQMPVTFPLQCHRRVHGLVPQFACRSGMLGRAEAAAPPRQIGMTGTVAATRSPRLAFFQRECPRIRQELSLFCIGTCHLFTDIFCRNWRSADALFDGLSSDFAGAKKERNGMMWVSLFAVAAGAAICLSVAALIMQPAAREPFSG